MTQSKIIESPYYFTGNDMGGKGVNSSVRLLRDLKGIFEDKEAFEAMDQNTVAYKVESLEPDPQGTPGGLYMGITFLSPGKVGKEYFMTKGHFHQNRENTEYYWGVSGEGMLILMDEDRNVWAERMHPGSLHYIPAHVAHRVANVGNETLVFAASWPSDAGHDYDSIAKNGFAKRLIEVDGKPELV
ncbi:MAG: glucose-6-phosphate isomerase family protein [Candidatus Cryptobacteroides sp.]